MPLSSTGGTSLPSLPSLPHQGNAFDPSTLMYMMRLMESKRENELKDEARTQVEEQRQGAIAKLRRTEAQAGFENEYQNVTGLDTRDESAKPFFEEARNEFNAAQPTKTNKLTPAPKKLTLIDKMLGKKEELPPPEEPTKNVDLKPAFERGQAALKQHVRQMLIDNNVDPLEADKIAMSTPLTPKSVQDYIGKRAETEGKIASGEKTRTETFQAQQSYPSTLMKQKAEARKATTEADTSEMTAPGFRTLQNVKLDKAQSEAIIANVKARHAETNDTLDRNLKQANLLLKAAQTANNEMGTREKSLQIENLKHNIIMNKRSEQQAAAIDQLAVAYQNNPDPEIRREIVANMLAATGEKGVTTLYHLGKDNIDMLATSIPKAGRAAEAAAKQLPLTNDKNIATLQSITDVHNREQWLIGKAKGYGDSVPIPWISSGMIGSTPTMRQGTITQGAASNFDQNKRRMEAPIQDKNADGSPITREMLVKEIVEKSKAAEDRITAEYAYLGPDSFNDLKKIIESNPNIDPRVKAVTLGRLKDADDIRKGGGSNRDKPVLGPTKPSKDPIDRGVEAVKSVGGRVLDTLKQGDLSTGEMDLTKD